jgi:hypothetical protein
MSDSSVAEHFYDVYNAFDPDGCCDLTEVFEHFWGTYIDQTVAQEACTVLKEVAEKTCAEPKVAEVCQQLCDSCKNPVLKNCFNEVIKDGKVCGEMEAMKAALAAFQQQWTRLHIAMSIVMMFGAIAAIRHMSVLQKKTDDGMARVDRLLKKAERNLKTAQSKLEPGAVDFETARIALENASEDVDEAIKCLDEIDAAAHEMKCVSAMYGAAGLVLGAVFGGMFYSGLSAMSDGSGGWQTVVADWASSSSGLFVASAGIKGFQHAIKTRADVHSVLKVAQELKKEANAAWDLYTSLKEKEPDDVKLLDSEAGELV